MIPAYVVRKFASQQALPLEQAELVFVDLEQYLRQASSAVVSPSHLVDEAWHAFILHTRDYASYCQEQFGKFIHHVPSSSEALAKADCSSNCKSCHN